MTEQLPTPPIANSGKFYIDGKWADPSSSATIDVIEAATEELYFTVAEARAADIERAVAAARRAFDEGPWPRMSPGRRAEYLRAIAQAVQEGASAYLRRQFRTLALFAVLVFALLWLLPGETGVKVGRSIPADLYEAFVEIMAYVYKITGRSPANLRGGRGVT